MELIASGRLAKMPVKYEEPVEYSLKLGDTLVDANALIGKRLRLVFEQEIRCCHCQRITKKSFNQGYCYPCFQRLASCDKCIMSPELCHYAQGTCREPVWGQQNCMQPHIVYLANSSGLKVGITRQSQVPTRWMDQGAISALPIVAVSSRKLSGLIENRLREWVTDRTNWRKMLKHEVEDIDLCAERGRLHALVSDYLNELRDEYSDESIEWLRDAELYHFDYPSRQWPDKAKTYNFDKTPDICDVLTAIKGQYLIFEQASLNIRKYGSYQVSLYDCGQA